MVHPVLPQSGAVSRRFSLGLLVLFATLSACRSQRDEFLVDLPPPTGRETIAEVLPVQIAGTDADIRTVELADGRLRVVRATYGVHGLIEIARSPVPADLSVYLADHVRPSLERLGMPLRLASDGAFVSASGEHGRALAWQNRGWLFVVAAESHEAFEEMIDRFAYIERW